MQLEKYAHMICFWTWRGYIPISKPGHHPQVKLQLALKPIVPQQLRVLLAVCMYEFGELGNALNTPWICLYNYQREVEPIGYSPHPFFLLIMIFERNISAIHQLVRKSPEQTSFYTALSYFIFFSLCFHCLSHVAVNLQWVLQKEPWKEWQ